MVDASTGTDQMAGAVDRFVRLSEEILGEIQLARAWLFRGNLSLYGTDPPDLDGGMAAIRTAIELADEMDASEVGTWGRITLADALTRRADPGAREATRAAVSMSFDVRYGMAVVTAVEVCARYLASAGDREGASVLLGHVDVDAPPWSIGADWRAALASAVAGTEHLDELKAVGAAMDRRRAVEYALEHLDSNFMPL